MQVKSQFTYPMAISDTSSKQQAGKFIDLMSSLNKASSDEEYNKLLEKAQTQWNNLTSEERDYARVGIDYLSERSAKGKGQNKDTSDVAKNVAKKVDDAVNNIEENIEDSVSSSVSSATPKQDYFNKLKAKYEKEFPYFAEEVENAEYHTEHSYNGNMDEFFASRAEGIVSESVRETNNKLNNAIVEYIQARQEAETEVATIKQNIGNANAQKKSSVEDTLKKATDNNKESSVKDTLEKATDNNIAALNEINNGVDEATKNIEKSANEKSAAKNKAKSKKAKKKAGEQAEKTIESNKEDINKGFDEALDKMADVDVDNNMNGKKAINKGTTKNFVKSIGSNIKGAVTGAISSIPSMLATAGVGALVGVGISSVAWAVDQIVNRSEHIQENAEEAKSVVKELQSAQESAVELYSNKDLINEYQELANRVDQNGNNISLSTDEFARYNELSNQIASTFPTLIQGYSATGDAILNTKSVTLKTESSFCQPLYWIWFFKKGCIPCKLYILEKQESLHHL